MILLELFITFFKIGLFTFGGGYAMLPLIEQEVMNHNWMELEQLVDFIAISESTPGPFAVNISTYVGTHTAGILGAICATLGVILPSFIIILLLVSILRKFQKSKALSDILSGLKPATIGLIATAFVSILITVFFSQGISLDLLLSYSFISMIIIFIICFIGKMKKLSAIHIILISACLGIIMGYLGELL